MANLNLLYQTLIRATTSPAYLFSAAKPIAIRCFSTQPESSSYAELTALEVEAKAVERIEDYIHAIIVHRSRPDWLPLVPGASYWVPPRRSSYGVSDVVYKLANALTDEEYLSLVTLQGWPSFAFYIHNDEMRAEASFFFVPHLDLMRAEASSIGTFHDEEG